MLHGLTGRWKSSGRYALQGVPQAARSSCCAWPLEPFGTFHSAALSPHSCVASVVSAQCANLCTERFEWDGLDFPLRGIARAVTASIVERQPVVGHDRCATPERIEPDAADRHARRLFRPPLQPAPLLGSIVDLESIAQPRTVRYRCSPPMPVIEQRSTSMDLTIRGSTIGSELSRPRLPIRHGSGFESTRISRSRPPADSAASTGRDSDGWRASSSTASRRALATFPTKKVQRGPGTGWRTAAGVVTPSSTFTRVPVRSSAALKRLCDFEVQPRHEGTAKDEAELAAHPRKRVSESSMKTSLPRR